MSSFKTKNFQFFSYDFSSKYHQDFVRELIKDPNVETYIKNIEAFIYRDTEIPLNNAYLVGKDDLIVGYINLFEERLIVEMDYAVSPNMRGIRNNSNETIGCQILRETSEYLFDSYDFIKFIRLSIAKSNIRSIKAAERAGFKLVNHYSDGEEYRKYPSL